MDGRANAQCHHEWLSYHILSSAGTAHEVCKHCGATCRRGRDGMIEEYDCHVDKQRQPTWHRDGQQQPAERR